MMDGQMRTWLNWRKNWGWLGRATSEVIIGRTPTSPSPRSAEAPPEEIQSREYTETTTSRPEELQDTSRNGTAQGLEALELQETEVVVEVVVNLILGKMQ